MLRADQFISKQNLLDWSNTLGIEFKTRSVKKGDSLLKQSQRCDHFYFVLDGFLRLYYLDLDGNEVTHWFSSKHTLVTSPLSFFRAEPNIITFEALEDTECWLITMDQLHLISDQIEGADRAIQNLYVEFVIKMSRRIMSIHNETAEYRYLKLIEEYPQIFQKAKLGHISSYLGITIQSLSRIRKRLVD
ncbi:hypothetical protein BKI52_06030 [marine bacterium AO1-C]|nr:hypothetical protein BKI52_06030 [marine bacterium AO1-C]